jgi:hypothetical protein
VLQQDHLPRISAGVEALVAASRTAIGADVPPQIPGFGFRAAAAGSSTRV